MIYVYRTGWPVILARPDFIKQSVKGLWDNLYQNFSSHKLFRWLSRRRRRLTGRTTCRTSPAPSGARSGSTRTRWPSYFITMRLALTFLSLPSFFQFWHFLNATYFMGLRKTNIFESRVYLLMYLSQSFFFFFGENCPSQMTLFVCPHVCSSDVT